MQTEPIARSYPATVIVTGNGSGAPLLLSEPLSFWGGYDSFQGRVLDSIRCILHSENFVGCVGG